MIKAKLSTIANVTMGQSPKGEFCGANIDGVSLLNGPAEFTVFYPLPVQQTTDPKKLCNKGDILFCVRGSTTGRMNWADKQYAIGRGLAAINHKKGQAYNVFLKYLIQNNLNSLLNNTNGSTFPNLTGDLITSFQVSFPEDNEQLKISKLLSNLDAKIELNNRINTELETMAKTLYDYWFVQFDFPDQNGKPYKSSGGKMIYNETLKRDIPEGWGSGTASDLFVFNPTISLSKNILSSYIDMSALPVSGFMTGSIKKKVYNGGAKFKNGDIAIARITPCLENGKTGMITLLEDDEIGFGSTEFIILRGKERVLSSFAACLSRSESFRKFAITNMTGTSGRKRIEANIMETYSMPIPEENLLEKFEQVLTPHFKKLTIHTKQNEQLTQLRDWLLPMLMNGQVTVK